MNPVMSEILENLEATSDKFWNISKQTGNFINMLIKSAKIKRVLEIGTSNGYSALRIADALKRTGGKLTTIEYWEKRQCLARDYVEKCGLSEYVEFKIGEACEVIDSQINDKFDLVFMDANKDEYLRFFNAVHPMIKEGGILLADNVLSHAKKVKPFIDVIMEHPDYQAQVLDLPDGLLMAYKLRVNER